MLQPVLHPLLLHQRLHQKLQLKVHLLHLWRLLRRRLLLWHLVVRHMLLQCLMLDEQRERAQPRSRADEVGLARERRVPQVQRAPDRRLVDDAGAPRFGPRRVGVGRRGRPGRSKGETD